MELWRAIPGFPDYEASNCGRIRSIGRWRPHNRNKQKSMWWPGKVLRPGKTKKQHLFVIVGNRKNRFVHRLVALAWLGAPPFPGALVRHWNDNFDDNTPNNLRWGTQTDNMQDALRNGRKLGGHRPAGSHCVNGVFL